MRDPIKGLRWALLILIAVLTTAVLIPPERSLLVLFEALAEYREPAASSAGGGLGALGVGLPGADALEPLSGEVRRDLARFGAWPRRGAADWWSFNRRYLVQLGYTLALMLPIGVLVAAIGYVLAVSLFQTQHAGRRRLAGTLDAALDTVPYVLWVLPMLSLAYALYFGEWWLSWPYWAYLMVIYVGFGAFLLPFLIHGNLQRLRILDRTGVLDGERVTGGSAPRIYWRVLWLELRRPFAYQALYATLFAMLLEFAAFDLVAFDQPLQRYTVFTQGNLYLRDADKAEAESRQDRIRSYAAELRDLLERHPPSAGTRWADGLRAEPVRAFDPALRRALRDHLTAVSAAGAPIPPGLPPALARLAVPDQRALYFDTVATVYLHGNAALVFVLFSALLIGFDLRGYGEYGHG
jgi:hypothetical protein